MCLPALPLAILGAGIIGGGAAAYSASKQASAMRAATASNEATAASQAQRSEEQFNKANQKAPDIAAMMSSNQQAMKQGIGATFLTGPSGVAPSALTLGKPSLLGS